MPRSAQVQAGSRGGGRRRRAHRAASAVRSSTAARCCSLRQLTGQERAWVNGAVHAGARRHGETPSLPWTWCAGGVFCERSDVSACGHQGMMNGMADKRLGAQVDIGASAARDAEILGATGAVVAGIDGSEADGPVADWAADEAHRLGAPLRLVNAIDPGVQMTSYEVLATGSPSLAERLSEDARQLLDATSARARARHPALDIAVSVPTGRVAAALVRLSEGAMRVVVCGPARGRSSASFWARSPYRSWRTGSVPWSWSRRERQSSLCGASSSALTEARAAIERSSSRSGLPWRAVPP